MRDMDPMCPNCGEEEKTLEHAILTCKEAQVVYFASQLGRGHFRPAKGVVFTYWLEDCFRESDVGFQQQIYGLLWSI